VSIQADVLNLLNAIQEESGITFLFISHDLSVIAHTCDFVAVMYLGQIVEAAPTHKLFSETAHPYTRALLSAIPSLDPDDQHKAQKLEGEIPSPINPPPGCRFNTRCPHAQERCRTEVPEWREMSSGHHVACHFSEELTAALES
jgi:oligopeptide/dipeptide ABC transporter ATP-binding protein